MKRFLKLIASSVIGSALTIAVFMLTGIKHGDVIVKVDEKPIIRSADLLEQIGRNRPGDDVIVTVNRKGKEFHTR